MFGKCTCKVIKVMKTTRIVLSLQPANSAGYNANGDRLVHFEMTTSFCNFVSYACASLIQTKESFVAEKPHGYTRHSCIDNTIYIYVYVCITSI